MEKTCIYCGNVKDSSEFSSLEHTIPQFLGGSFAPDKFKTRDACDKCNNGLGLFADAAFEKNWVVSNWLKQSAMAFFDPENPEPLPLICMGNTTITPPGMQDNEICESWIGALGEQIYWIRPKDEELYWYVGGSPTKARRNESRAYFLFSERSLENPLLTWLSFRDAFKKLKKVKKIMCTEVRGANPEDIRFSMPDDLDKERISFFRTHAAAGAMKNQLALNVRFDQRFLAKLAIGIGYCLFGSKALQSEYGKELRKGIWYREQNSDATEDSSLPPRIRGTTLWGHEQNDQLSNFIGEQHAVTLVIIPSTEGVAVNLRIGKTLSWTVMCASHEGLEKTDMEYLGDGKVILLYKYLKKGFCLTLPEYLAYKLGHFQHDELNAINKKINKHAGYFKDLGS